jgi:MbtH protein
MNDVLSASDPSEDLYFVVRNKEEQYSIWRIDQAIPAGWEQVGDSDVKSRCLERIKELWTDMRPASLRNR